MLHHLLSTCVAQQQDLSNFMISYWLESFGGVDHLETNNTQAVLRKNKIGLQKNENKTEKSVAKIWWGNI